MDRQISQVLSLGLKCQYVYDMGSSTNLEPQIIAAITCPPKKVTLLMQDEAPSFTCEFCKKTADIICSFCGETLCSVCCGRHSCAINEQDTYMMMSIINSPRTGVCGYGED